MDHPVGSFVARGDGYKPLESSREVLGEAQRYLAANGAAAFGSAAFLEGGERWGIAAKLIKVTFSEGPRPALIGQGLDGHNLAEVVNQCATMESVPACHYGRAPARGALSAPPRSACNTARAATDCRLKTRSWNYLREMFFRIADPSRTAICRAGHTPNPGCPPGSGR